MKKIIVVSIIAIILLITAIIFVGKIFRGGNEKTANDRPAIEQADESGNWKETEKSSGYDQTLSFLPSCPDGKELFNTFPVKEGDYTGIIPLGNLNPAGHTFPTDHIYVEIHDPQRPAAVIKVSGRKALVAPADMWISSVSKSEQIGGITDWAMDFSPCKDVEGKFGHVGTISPKLQAEIDKVKANCNEYETGGDKYRHCKFDGFKLWVKAGEEIGTAGSERSGMLDIWMSDYREPQIKRANPARWSSDRNHVSCFLDYYPAPQKEQYYDLLRGPNNGKRTKEPRCGTVDVDIAGTAQGIWFYNLAGMLQNEDPHLALVFDNIETGQQVFSVGTAAGGAGIPSGVYSFIPQSEGQVNRDFSQVAADGKVYCYDTQNKNRRGVRESILLAMPTAEKIRIKKLAAGSCGAGPWQMPAGYAEYER